MHSHLLEWNQGCSNNPWQNTQNALFSNTYNLSCQPNNINIFNQFGNSSDKALNWIQSVGVWFSDQKKFLSNLMIWLGTSNQRRSSGPKTERLYSTTACQKVKDDETRKNGIGKMDCDVIFQKGNIETDIWRLIFCGWKMFQRISE